MAGKCVARETLSLLKRSTSPDICRKIAWANVHRLLGIPAPETMSEHSDISPFRIQ